MSETKSQPIQQQLADLETLRQELEEMMSRVDRSKRSKDRTNLVQEPVLVVSGK